MTTDHPWRRCLSPNSFNTLRRRRSRQVPVATSVVSCSLPAVLKTIRRASTGRHSPNARSTRFTRASKPSVLAGTTAATWIASTDTASPGSACTASARRTPSANSPPTPPPPLTLHSRTRKVGSFCCRSRSRAPTSSTSCFPRRRALTTRTTRRAAPW